MRCRNTATGWFMRGDEEGKRLDHGNALIPIDVAIALL